MSYWFQHLTPETSFYHWYTYWNNFSVAVGTGTVSFNNVEIQDTLVGTGQATFKSNVYIDNYKQHISCYNLDADWPPTISTICNRTISNFVNTHNTAIWFKFPIDNFHKITDDKIIKLTYAQSGSGSTSVSFDAFYYISKEDSELSLVADGTATTTFVLNNVPNELDSNSSLTIPSASITADTNWIMVKLERHPTYSVDTAENFYLFDIEIT